MNTTEQKEDYELMYVEKVDPKYILDEDNKKDLRNLVKGIQGIINAKNTQVWVRFGKNWTGTKNGWNIYPKYTIVFDTLYFSERDLYEINKLRRVDNWGVQWGRARDSTNGEMFTVLKVRLEV